jgi:hypothetical protein
MAIDSTTQVALQSTILNWRALLYIDFLGDTLRATSSIYNKTISASGDAELDGTYIAYGMDIMEVGPVKHNETGSDTVTVNLNGLVVNTDLLNAIGDRSKWQGRTARLWFFIADQNEAQVGSIVPYYTGYMNDVVINGSANSQTITLTIENYLASLSGAPNKTYMMQNLFDPGDYSASASLGAANGIATGTSAGYNTMMGAIMSGKFGGRIVNK